MGTGRADCIECKLGYCHHCLTPKQCTCHRRNALYAEEEEGEGKANRRRGRNQPSRAKLTTKRGEIHQR